MKVAVLSNTNMNSVIQMLKHSVDVYNSEGYGNELGTLMNPYSSLYTYEPDMIVVIEDMMELLQHDLDEVKAESIVREWFRDIEGTIRNSCIYYISDAYLLGDIIKVCMDKGVKFRLEAIWQEELYKLVSNHSNIRVFPYRSIIERIGEHAAFSTLTWYMGKIMYSIAMQQELQLEILNCIRLEEYIPKKVLLLDLDNTLWGGLAGEDNITPVILSDDSIGAAYKDYQRVILQMRKQGVILGIVSKNNVEDAQAIIAKHPHMVLHNEDFAIQKINWNHKSENIKQIAEELNLGMDSFVFIDDNELERQEVRELLPEVVVPDFPERPEELAKSMIKIWRDYFARNTVTNEDLNKTEQYTANTKREDLKREMRSFEEYLDNLQIVLTRKNEQKYVERITQLINKTNQFNLTTIRHTQTEIQEMINDSHKKLFVYQVSDRFGDSGIVAVAIVDITEDAPIIQEFVMSCRVMGKQIEHAIMDDIENFYFNQGKTIIYGEYAATSRNAPVAGLYKDLGYQENGSTGNCVRYELNLRRRPFRYFKLTKTIDKDVQEKNG